MESSAAGASTRDAPAQRLLKEAIMGQEQPQRQQDGSSTENAIQRAAKIVTRQITETTKLHVSRKDPVNTDISTTLTRVLI